MMTQPIQVDLGLISCLVKLNSLTSIIVSTECNLKVFLLDSTVGQKKMLVGKFSWADILEKEKFVGGQTSKKNYSG